MIRNVKEISDRKNGRGIILYVQEYIQAHEIKLERGADDDDAVWCKVISGNSTFTIGLIYQNPKHKRR